MKRWFGRFFSDSASSTLQVGAGQEIRALHFLRNKGWKLIAKNFRGKFGEIDLIFQDGARTIVFVEVRFRRSEDFGGGIYSVGKAKQEKVLKTAIQYVKENGLQNRTFRFDVVALSPERIEHVENAFSSEAYTL